MKDNRPHSRPAQSRQREPQAWSWRRCVSGNWQGREARSGSLRSGEATGGRQGRGGTAPGTSSWYLPGYVARSPYVCVQTLRPDRKPLEEMKQGFPSLSWRDKGKTSDVSVCVCVCVDSVQWTFSNRHKSRENRTMNLHGPITQ